MKLSGKMLELHVRHEAEFFKAARFAEEYRAKNSWDNEDRWNREMALHGSILAGIQAIHANNVEQAKD